MFAVTGVSGQVGSAVASALLDRQQGVRAVVRDPRKGDPWRARGASVAVADLLDSDALTRAFEGVDGVFVLFPPGFAPSPGFPEALAYLDAVARALERAAPPRLVCLSTVGAQHERGTGILYPLHRVEQRLGQLTMPRAFVRAAWFMENASWDVAPARTTGEVASFLQPLDRSIPMVATADVGRTAARMLTESWTGTRVIEVEGPRRHSPDDVARSLAAALGRSVRAVAVPRDRWASLFATQGASWPEPRIEMLDGFNRGHITFAGEGTEHVRGERTLDDVMRELVARS